MSANETVESVGKRVEGLAAAITSPAKLVVAGYVVLAVMGKISTSTCSSYLWPARSSWFRCYMTIF